MITFSAVFLCSAVISTAFNVFLLCSHFMKTCNQATSYLNRCQLEYLCTNVSIHSHWSSIHTPKSLLTGMMSCPGAEHTHCVTCRYNAALFPCIVSLLVICDNLTITFSPGWSVFAACSLTHVRVIRPTVQHSIAFNHTIFAFIFHGNNAQHRLSANCQTHVSIHYLCRRSSPSSGYCFMGELLMGELTSSHSTI